MKIELEPQEIEAIAQRVAELIKPMLSKSYTRVQDEQIFTTKSLAGYLQVKPSWVYKRVSNGEIPYFKHGKYTRFKKSAIDKWLEKHSLTPLQP